MSKCLICGILVDKNNSYINKNDIRIPICKECISKKIDIFNPLNTPEVFELFDIPILTEEWNRIIIKYPQASMPFGRYLSKMKLKGYINFKFKDTNFFNKKEWS